MSARIPKTCASLMKLGPSDAIVSVSLRARSRWASSDTNRGGPAKIQRRLSRKNAIRNGERRYQTTKILKIIRTFKLLQIYWGGLRVSSLGLRLQAMRNLQTRLASGRSEISRTRPRLQ